MDIIYIRPENYPARTDSSDTNIEDAQVRWVLEQRYGLSLSHLLAKQDRYLYSAAMLYQQESIPLEQLIELDNLDLDFQNILQGMSEMASLWTSQDSARYQYSQRSIILRDNNVQIGAPDVLCQTIEVGELILDEQGDIDWGLNFRDLMIVINTNLNTGEIISISVHNEEVKKSITFYYFPTLDSAESFEIPKYKPEAYQAIYRDFMQLQDDLFPAFQVKVGDAAKYLRIMCSANYRET